MYGIKKKKKASEIVKAPEYHGADGIAKAPDAYTGSNLSAGTPVPVTGITKGVEAMASAKLRSAKKKAPEMQEDKTAYSPDVGYYPVKKNKEGAYSETGEEARLKYIEKLKQRKK